MKPNDLQEPTQLQKSSLEGYKKAYRQIRTKASLVNKAANNRLLADAMEENLDACRNRNTKLDEKISKLNFKNWCLGMVCLALTLFCFGALMKILL